MGELGWSLERWKSSTVKEFNYACSGYWRNWERFVGVPMREICFVNIAGNPNIKDSSKPKSVQDYLKLSIDDNQGKVPERPTEEEIKIAQNIAFYGKEKSV